MSNDVISKIQKLFALSGSSNEHEAALALTKAQALMLAHNLSMEAIENFESHTESYIKEKYQFTGRNGPRCKDHITRIMKEFFFVRVVYYSGGFYIFGESSNVEIARRIYEILVNEFEHLWKRYRIREGCGVSSQLSYYRGLEIGFSNKLRDERKGTLQTTIYTPKALLENQPGMTGTDIVLAHDLRLEEEYKKAFTNLGKIYRNTSLHSGSALEAGKRDGRNINISRSVGRENKKLSGY